MSQIVKGTKGGKPLTQRDVAESVLGLQQVAAQLRTAAKSQPLSDYGSPVVAVTVSGITDNATFIEQVADELLTLIDGEVALEVPPGTPQTLQDGS